LDVSNPPIQNLKQAGIMRRLIVILMSIAGLASPAIASANSPVIGCIRLNDFEAGRPAWQSAPWNCTTGGSLGSTEGIWHVRWSGWGHRTSTGRRYLVDGLGFMHPAKITAFRMRRTYTGRKCYTRLHAIAKAVFAGIVRGPYNVFIDVTPD
jgi:hypothetical protein